LDNHVLLWSFLPLLLLLLLLALPVPVLVCLMVMQLTPSLPLHMVPHA
jgi:hypothetical protein